MAVVLRPRRAGRSQRAAGYWDNDAEGREPRTVIRDDRDTVQRAASSTIDIPVGEDLKAEDGLGHHDRLTREVHSEAWTSGECPACGSTIDTKRYRDTLSCRCGSEGHADLTASETFLHRHEPDGARPMARPVCCNGGRPSVVGVNETRCVSFAHQKSSISGVLTTNSPSQRSASEPARYRRGFGVTERRGWNLVPSGAGGWQSERDLPVRPEP
ncbi:MAG: zinc ribbon domain-containing protein [Halobacteriales archaeon]